MGTNDIVFSFFKDSNMYPVVSTSGFFLKLLSMLEDDCFEIEYDGRVAEVKYRVEDGFHFYQIEWPDHSRDFIYLSHDHDPPAWMSKTEMDRRDVLAIVRLIEEKS